jgi:LuxR family transcriptional regulator, maltose regulon positive regulatory protein
MASPILATKLFVPPPRPELVRRPRLIERLNAGLGGKLILVSAPAGFGKTTLLGEWVPGCTRPVTWLSLDEGDSDPARFLMYLIAALQKIAATVGDAVLGALRSAQPPPPESILTALLNDIATISGEFVLVLDDYHIVDARSVDDAVAFLVEHLPPQMHLVIATREDPRLPLGRLRAQGQLAELRVVDLRFTQGEAAGFLNQVMHLDLSTDDIAALEARTEGWIAGLQLAAISMQGHGDAAAFIESFTGGHHFVLDYLTEEVLRHQSESVQAFLLRTSILERLCGPLCDAVALDPATSGQETLEYLERANLFTVPLDEERRWYRYHHLFADLLRQRLPERDVAELHVRASRWFEDSGMEVDAFRHAAAANDVARAERLIEGRGMPLHFRGAVAPVLTWVASLPDTVLDAWPSLWTAYASVLLATGQITAAEQKLQAAEAALRDAEPHDRARDLLGRIAAIRATAAAGRNEVDAIIAQSRRALELLHPDNLAFRTSTAWKLGYAYHLQGDRAAASRAYAEVISIGRPSGNTVFTLMATIGLGGLHEVGNQLSEAAASYRRALQLAGEPPLPSVCEAHLGLARICYEWNDLDAARRHAQQGSRLARQMEIADRVVGCSVVLARLKLAQGDGPGAEVVLAEAAQLARQHNFVERIPEVAAAQVLALLHGGNVAAADRLARAHDLPVSRARTHLARGDPAAALAVLGPWRQQVEARGLEDERLRVMALQAVAHHAHGDEDEAARLLGDALALAEPGGFIRTFVDEGRSMARLLSAAAAHGISPHYAGRLLAAFDAQPLVEPLSRRELEVLRLVAGGLSNHEICERLFLALNTVKGHNRRIFDKLQVRRRTEAVARARELGLI